MRLVCRCFHLLLGAILGPAACVTSPEYGPPSALYLLDGHVVTAPSGVPIPGIMVDFHGNRAVTGVDGSWNIQANIILSGDVDFLEVRDTDGEENGGLFTGETVHLSPTFVGGQTWEQHEIFIDLDPAE